jgi:hypothetical protein
MFLLNTILAWNINIIMNKKYDNNNIIIASRAYFLQHHRCQTAWHPRAGRLNTAQTRHHPPAPSYSRLQDDAPKEKKDATMPPSSNPEDIRFLSGDKTMVLRRGAHNNAYKKVSDTYGCCRCPL